MYKITALSLAHSILSKKHPKVTSIHNTYKTLYSIFNEKNNLHVVTCRYHNGFNGLWKQQ